MAKYEDPKLTVSVTLDDESKELLRALVKAVDRMAPPAEQTDKSFADAPKRLAEPGGSYGAAQTLDYPIRKIEYGGRVYRLHMEGEGDYQLYDDGHEGEELE